MRTDSLTTIGTVMDRLAGYISQFTIRSVLFIGFALVIVLGIITTLLTEWTDDQAMDALNRLIAVDNEVSVLCLTSNALMINARKGEKDFILTYKDFGFSEARSRYISRALADLADIRENMKKIRLLTNEPEVVSQTGKVDQAIGGYQEKLLAMVDKYGEVGAYDSGLEKEFREAAHEIESLLDRENDDRLLSGLLSLRRREKDFIMRRRDSDAAEFHEALARLRADTARSGLTAEERERIGKLTERYSDRFEEYVKTTEEIRTIKADLRKKVEVIEPTLERLSAIAGREVAESLDKISKGDRLYAAIKAGASLAAGLVSISAAGLIVVVISRKVGENKAFAEQIASGNLEKRLTPEGKNEFAALTVALNQMAESLLTADLRQKGLAAELRASEQGLRKLSEELELKVVERTKQLREAQEELVRNEKLAMLGLISGAMGNELRNPLAVINNAVYLLRGMTHGRDGTLAEYLDIIRREIDSSERILADLLAFNGIIAPRTRPLSVAELIDNSLKRCAMPENIRLQAEIPDVLPALRVDPVHMEQVLQHLITNAVLAMPEGGDLRISARRAKFTIQDSAFEIQDPGKYLEQGALHLKSNADFVEIAISDTGEGISAENMKRLFQPLFTTRSRGMGLGLSLSKRLTEANGGTIEAASEVGNGAVFTVSIPVAE